MRILITNDDGIDAPGLACLRKIAAELSDDVWVVAPEENNSGAGHSLSLNKPLRMRELEPKVFAVRGTPTDCVIMGVRHVMTDKRPDLVLSGVNRGANLAEDVTYSGTIAGAFEGTVIGIRSIALSLAYGFESAVTDLRWETPLAHGPAVVRSVLDIPWDAGVLMNINFPDRKPVDVEGIEVTAQGKRDQDVLGIDARADPWGTPYFWLAYERRRSNPARGTDLWAIYNGFISVTPLSMNLTHSAHNAALAEALARARR